MKRQNPGVNVIYRWELSSALFCSSSSHFTFPWMTFPTVSPISPLASVCLFSLLSYTMSEAMECQFSEMMFLLTSNFH